MEVDWTKPLLSKPQKPERIENRVEIGRVMKKKDVVHEIRFVCAKCGASQHLTVQGRKWMVRRFLKKIGCIYPCGVNGCKGNKLKVEET